MSYAVSFYNQFHAIERRSADELADALPFMKWAPSATCGANIARHGAVQLGRMARVEYEIWGGNQRLLQVLRTVAGQVGKAAIHAAVYVGYAVLVAVALVYDYGSEWISDYVESSQQVSPVRQASDEVMAEMEGAGVEEPAIAPLPICPESGETSDILLMADEPIQSEPIDWAVWAPDDLKKASQRTPFNIPLRIDGKVATKPQLIELYQQAMECAIA